MVKKEVHKLFKLALDKSASGVDFGGAPAFLTEEIDALLDQATLEVISNKYSGSQNQIAFEGSAKRIADLEELIGTALQSPLAGNQIISNAVTFSTPDDFLFYVDGVIKADDNIFRLSLISHGDSQKFMVTADNNPYIPTPVCVLENGKIKVFYDNQKIKSVQILQLNYIFQPDSFAGKTKDETIDLSDSLIHEIINRAALLALENIESNRTQLKAQLNAIQE